MLNPSYAVPGGGQPSISIQQATVGWPSTSTGGPALWVWKPVFLSRRSIPIGDTVISRHPPQSPASAWTGTEIRFDLSRRASPGAWRGLPHEGEPMTVLEFHHLGWNGDSEYLGFCSQAWAETLVMLRRWAEASIPPHS